MIEFKTFSNELGIFDTMKELMELDEKVTRFVSDHKFDDELISRSTKQGSSPALSL